jgi:hypothetical protein
MKWLSFHKIKIVVGLTALVFLIFGGQKACDARNAAREDERLAALTAERLQRQKDFEAYITIANAQHETTVGILDTMARSINILSDNDKKLTVRVNQIAEGDYKAARTQKRSEPTIAERHRPNRNLRQREDDILEMDGQLYP